MNNSIWSKFHTKILSFCILWEFHSSLGKIIDFLVVVEDQKWKKHHKSNQNWRISVLSDCLRLLLPILIITNSKLLAFPPQKRQRSMINRISRCYSSTVLIAWMQMSPVNRLVAPSTMFISIGSRRISSIYHQSPSNSRWLKRLFVILVMRLERIVSF